MARINHKILNVVEEHQVGFGFLAFEKETVMAEMSFRQFDIIHDRVFSNLYDNDVIWHEDSEVSECRDHRYAYFSFEVLYKNAPGSCRDLFLEYLTGLNSVLSMAKVSPRMFPGFSGNRSFFMFAEHSKVGGNVQSLKIKVLLSNNVFYSDYRARAGFWVEHENEFEDFVKQITSQIEDEIQSEFSSYFSSVCVCEVNSQGNLEDQ